MTHELNIEPQVWPLGGYAPGNYTCTCFDCGKQHIADKRASQCLECAVLSVRRATPAKTDMGGLVERLRAEERAAADSLSAPLIAEAASALSASEARIAELEAEVSRLQHDVESAGALRLRMEAHKQSAQAAEARIAELLEALDVGYGHIEQLSELLKILKESWIDYDHVYSIAVHDADEFRAARQALSGSKDP